MKTVKSLLFFGGLFFFFFPFVGISTFLDYLMTKPSFKKNCGDTI